MSPKVFDKYARDDLVKWVRVNQAANIQVDQHARIHDAHNNSIHYAVHTHGAGRSRNQPENTDSPAQWRCDPRPGGLAKGAVSGAPCRRHRVHFRCDVLIVTDALVAQLTASGELVSGNAQTIGVAKTGIAVKAGDSPLDVQSRSTLKAALLAARGI